jgi:hypothetical protein
MHRREQADAAQAMCRGPGDAVEGVVARRVEHEEADEAIGMGGDRRRHRRLVARHRGDERGSRHAVGIQGRHPPRRQRRHRRRRLPFERLRHLADAILGRQPLLRPQRVEESRREEVHVGVADHRRGSKAPVVR